MSCTMSITKIFLIAAFLVSCTLPLSLSKLADNCPKAGDIDPCTCKPNYDGACILTCNAVKAEDLVRLTTIPKLCNGHVHFVLVHSKIQGIPTELWKILLSSETVDVSVQHSTVEHLIPLDDDDIPEIYTPGEAVIRFGHSADIGGWQWRQLQHFAPGGELTIVIDDTLLTKLTLDFALIGKGNVHKVTIDNTQLTVLPDGIFGPFDLLSSLSIQNNNLTEVKRSMFPWPAPKLQYLHINGNFLTELPGDLFVDMPSLEIVYIRANNLNALPDNLFTSINSKNIHLLDFVNNPWVCNCHLMKITSESSLHMDMGICASPNSLAGKKVVDLPSILDC